MAGWFISAVCFVLGTVLLVRAFYQQGLNRNVLKCSMVLLGVSLLLFMASVTVQLIDFMELLDLVGE